MTENTDPCPVSDTAALVMLWASGYFATQPVMGAYIKRLDLSAGQPLLERYNTICPWYSEVIINRKHFIKSTVETLVGNDAKRTVIVNLGAGFSPLALELSPLLCDRVRFIEIDMRNMSRKHELYAELVPDRCGFISGIEADITDTAGLEDALKHEMEDPACTRVIVVMEGLTYYIGRSAMARMITFLSEFVPDLSIVFEHLKPCRLVSDERRFIPYGIFSHICDYTSLDRMTTYSKDDIHAMLGPGFSVCYSDMDEMERERTGTHRYFPVPDSGWLSCAVAVRRPVTG